MFYSVNEQKEERLTSSQKNTLRPLSMTWSLGPTEKVSSVLAASSRSEDVLSYLETEV